MDLIGKTVLSMECLNMGCCLIFLIWSNKYFQNVEVLCKTKYEHVDCVLISEDIWLSVGNGCLIQQLCSLFNVKNTDSDYSEWMPQKLFSVFFFFLDNFCP